MIDMTHLIENWQFCDGSHFQDGIPELNVPDGWALDYADNAPIPEVDPPVIGVRPECLPVSIWDVGGEQGKFGQSPPNPGAYNAIFKVHKWSAPFAFDLVQTISGLEPGKRYLVRAWAFPDFYDENGDPPNDPYAAAFGIGFDGSVDWQWPLEMDTWLTFEREFVAEAESIDLSLSGLAKWGLPGNTFWLHGARLYLLDDGDEPPEPPTEGVVELGEETRAFMHDQVTRILEALTAVVPDEPDPPPPEDSVPWSKDLRDSLPRNHNCTGILSDGWWQRRVEQIDALTFHHTVREDDDPAPLAQWYCFEKDSNGRPSLPYTLWIKRDGTVALCNSLTEGCWHDHTGHENTHLSVGVVGDLTKREPTPEQYEAMVRVARWAIDHPVMQISRQDITGHMHWTSTACPGWESGWRENFFAMLDGEETTPPSPPSSGPVLLGFNDEEHAGSTGADWMMANGLQGLIVRPVYVGTSPHTLDYSAEAAAGLRVIVNLRYSWSTDAGGQGTLPVPDSPLWYEFITAAQSTILRSAGVWGWTISNEANNPREHPGGGELFADDVQSAYLAIRDGCNDVQDLRMAPGALDPYNAQRGDPRDWLQQIWQGIPAEFVAFHGYTRGPDPDRVGDPAHFQDAPMTWQRLNYPGCVATMRDALPSAYQDLDVYVTEFNHLWGDGGEGDWGWVDDPRAAEIVWRAVEAASEFGFRGLALYRWAQDAWALHNNTHVKAAVRELAKS